MTRVNIDILGISELKWTGMGEFNSDDHYIYYCGQESLRRHGVAIMVNKRVRNAVLGCNLKNDRMISVRFQGKPFNITVIQVYALTHMLKKLKLNGSMKSFLELTPKIDALFTIEDKNRKSRDTWSNGQIWSWSTKQSRSKDNSFAKRTHWS